MDNREIALHLTVAAMNNQLVGKKELIEHNLVTEEIADFYTSLLDRLNQDEELKG